MAAGGSTKVVVYALLANAGIAIAKFVAYAFTGSGAMLAEGIHSVADSGNQALLLLGAKRSQKPADEEHPVGYGREAYFWGLLVAAVLFVLGGLFSLYEGVHKLQHPEPLTSPGWAIAVLILGILLEGGSLRAAWIVCRKARGEQSLLEWASHTDDVNLLVVVFEDMAAQAGLLIALVAVGMTVVTGDPVYDAVGTLAIAVLLLGVAVFVASEVRRLIVGYTAPKPMRDGIRRIWRENGFEVLRIIAVWVGVDRLMVATKVRPIETGRSAADLIKGINTAERTCRETFTGIAYQFSEPDISD